MDALSALRARRSERRTEHVDRFDAFYQAYITALLAGVAVLVMSGWIGDAKAAVAATTVAADGRAWLGVATAAAVGTGLRSGSRGGPMAIEAADVRHVYLSPIPMGDAIRGPALRQARTTVAAAAAAGAIGGLLATHRLPGNLVAWSCAGALWAVVTAVAAIGAGWLASGRRMRPSHATLLATALIGWSVLTAVAHLGSSPMVSFGAMGVLPLDSDPTALLAPPIAVALAVTGLLSLGGISLERLARRSSLVGQLRFAATMRDLRTVMLLRRQLNQERPRSRPWLRARRRGGHTVVVLRDWRALLRTPLTRLLRVGALLVAAAAAGVGVWQGTTALILIAGLCSFLAGLEALEPLAQEIDHCTLLDLAAVRRGAVLVRHLIVPTVLLSAMGVVAAAVLSAFVPSSMGVALLTGAVAPVAGVAGAAISTLRDGDGPGAQAIDQLMLPPEAVGMRLLYRMAWPPAVATAGFGPVLAARQAVTAGADPTVAATNIAVLVAMLAGAVAVWVRYHDEWRTRWADASALTRPD